MNDEFSKEIVMLQEKVKFARELKATTLVISGKGGDDITKNIKPQLTLNR